MPTPLRLLSATTTMTATRTATAMATSPRMRPGGTLLNLMKICQPKATWWTHPKKECQHFFTWCQERKCWRDHEENCCQKHCWHQTKSQNQTREERHSRTAQHSFLWHSLQWLCHAWSCCHTVVSWWWKRQSKKWVLACHSSQLCHARIGWMWQSAVPRQWTHQSVCQNHPHQSFVIWQHNWTKLMSVWKQTNACWKEARRADPQLRQSRIADSGQKWCFFLTALFLQQFLREKHQNGGTCCTFALLQCHEQRHQLHSKQSCRCTAMSEKAEKSVQNCEWFIEDTIEVDGSSHICCGLKCSHTQTQRVVRTRDGPFCPGVPIVIAEPLRRKNGPSRERGGDFFQFCRTRIDAHCLELLANDPLDLVNAVLADLPSNALLTQLSVLPNLTFPLSLKPPGSNREVNKRTVQRTWHNTKQSWWTTSQRDQIWGSCGKEWKRKAIVEGERGEAWDKGIGEETQQFAQADWQHLQGNERDPEQQSRMFKQTGVQVQRAPIKFLPWSGNCDNCGSCSVKWSVDCESVKQKTCHVASSGVACKLRWALKCSQQTRARCGCEIEWRLGDGHLNHHVQQQACLHMQHPACLGEDMGMLIDGEHWKIFGAHQWSVKTILMTSCCTWDSGNRCHCPQTERTGNSVCATGSRDWSKWWGSLMDSPDFNSSCTTGISLVEWTFTLEFPWNDMNCPHLFVPHPRPLERNCGKFSHPAESQIEWNFNSVCHTMQERFHTQEGRNVKIEMRAQILCYKNYYHSVRKHSSTNDVIFVQKHSSTFWHY